MIEYTGDGYPQWWTGTIWSSDCHNGIQFSNSNDAVNYIVDHKWEVPVEVTEHICMSPLSTVENLN